MEFYSHRDFIRVFESCNAFHEMSRVYLFSYGTVVPFESLQLTILSCVSRNLDIFTDVTSLLFRLSYTICNIVGYQSFSVKLD